MPRQSCWEFSRFHQSPAGEAFHPAKPLRLRLQLLDLAPAIRSSSLAHVSCQPCLPARAFHSSSFPHPRPVAASSFLQSSILPPPGRSYRGDQTITATASKRALRPLAAADSTWSSTQMRVSRTLTSNHPARVSTSLTPHFYYPSSFYPLAHHHG